VRSQIEWKGAQWVEAPSRWHVYLCDLKTGEEFIHEAKVLISAVGGYSNPKFPVLPGLEQFEGPAVHPAQWNKEYDLRGVMDVCSGPMRGPADH
jgi:cation diffusion facilitator CzcD-associated flavoprotein CzcO